jgi:hypothetical protein
MMVQVRDLARSVVFKELPLEEQTRIASTLQDLATHVRKLKPESVSTQGQGQNGAFARELRLEGQQRRKSDMLQKAAFGALVEQVDFPKFVGDLINGVFNAIVDSSIQQMDSYSKLLSEVANSIEDRRKPAGC